MSTKLFEKVVVFTDIHFGLRHNAREHNEDCLEFLNWLIEQARLRGAETCIFMGDWHHHRSNINILTLDYTMQALRKLNASFKKSYVMVGNHDLFYREKREIHSMVVGSEFPNIVLINEPLVIDDVAFIPWLIEDEWKEVANIKSKYLFGHLELPGFKMNAMVEMPDHGALNSTHFEHQDYVFSGHFHKRQTKGKINYIGNPFGHNYSDVWDFERGGMFLEWDKEPEFLDYESGPRFISINLAALLENPDLYLKPKTYLQVTLDVNITYEEASFLRETFLSQYSVREFKIVKNQDDELSKDYSGDITVKTVDQIVIEQLTKIDSDSFDTKLLVEIYNGL
ncbi:MAG TPA: metallophosphoesterase [Ignavibacteriaceae bacterium]